MEKIDLTNLLTEQRNNRSRDLDLKSTRDLLTLMNEEDAQIAKAIQAQLPVIAQAVDRIYARVRDGGRVFYLGAGTSGRLGVLDASEILPTYGNGDIFIGLIAGGDTALRNPVEGAEDDRDAAVRDLQRFNLTHNDVVVGIGASGRTPYVSGGLEYGEDCKALTISLAMTTPAEFATYADINIEVLSGPEIVTGSTRMKAGTATKMVLNMLSTAVMIKMGTVYDNLMVDVKASNQKLLNRCVKIVREVTGASDESIIQALNGAGMDVKVAIVMVKKGLDAQAAQTLLANRDNNLRKVIG